jgi:hypothetical protein
VWVVGSCVNLQLFPHLPAKFVLGQHSANRELEHSLRMTLQQFFGSYFFESARPTGMVAIKLILKLVSGEHYFFSIDYYDVITHIHIWSVGWLVLAHQQARSGSSKPPDGFSIGIDHEPVAGLFEILPAGNECLHDTNLQIFLKENEQKEYEMVMSLSS